MGIVAIEPSTIVEPDAVHNQRASIPPAYRKRCRNRSSLHHILLCLLLDLLLNVGSALLVLAKHARPIKEPLPCVAKLRWGILQLIAGPRYAEDPSRFRVAHFGGLSPSIFRTTETGRAIAIPGASGLPSLNRIATTFPSARKTGAPLKPGSEP